ncbi:MAG: hypothetical protein CMI63_03980 [Parvularcula sp.]|nr:hypothetical protein [Parvularcula sp.]|tara:strand:- start:87 stop:308 length:222 start_codon:yes stop_codon:yes gene_type:complete
MLNKTFHRSDEDEKTWIALRFNLEAHDFQVIRHRRSNDATEETIQSVTEFWASADESEIDAFVTFLDSALTDS